MEEKRTTTRVAMNSEVVILKRGKKVKGVIRDLSMNGAYILIQNGAEPWDDIDISISVKKDKTSLTTSLKGVVSRKDAEGIGVQFVGLDMDSFKIIRDIARMYAEDPDKIENDLRRLNIKSITQ